MNECHGASRRYSNAWASLLVSLAGACLLPGCGDGQATNGTPSADQAQPAAASPAGADSTPSDPEHSAPATNPHSHAAAGEQHHVAHHDSHADTHGEQAEHPAATGTVHGEQDDHQHASASQQHSDAESAESHRHHDPVHQAAHDAHSPARREPRAAEEGGGSVRLLRTPGGGLQPQAAVDSQGNVHLVYLSGDPRASNVQYVRRAPGDDEFAEPVRVNTEPGSAIAIGTIRGAQMAVGRDGRVHVAWNGSGGEMWYARSNDDRTAFEPQRNLMQYTYALDGGGSVAADGAGNVYVVWHAAEEGGPPGEDGRRVYVAHSRDDGATFAPEVAVFGEQSGACGCCGLRAMADAAGDLYVLYRSGWDEVHRDTYLLACAQGSLEDCAGEVLDPWLTNQ